MKPDSAIGSMRVVPRRPEHVHGDGDDGTTTRMGKALAMLHGINMHSPAAHSMERHRRRRRSTAIMLAIVVALVCALAVRWFGRPL